MNTPRPKYFCPQCSLSYTTDQNFCGRCGADMKHVSGLAYAALNRSGSHDQLATASGEDDWDDESGEYVDDEAELIEWQRSRERRSQGRDPWLGRVVDGRYKVIEVVGRGGMGVVYKVEHQRMGKIAAMKVLHGDLANEPDVVNRFRREASAVSRLNHPNTVQVFDFGTNRGQLYLIMEYVRGMDLGSLVNRDGALPFDRAAPLFGQICSALSEAHDLGVIHRDLKPENILVTRTHAGRDFVKVLDFGLAKLSEREEANEVTDRGSIVGTPYYMSPEQIRGEEEVDARSDLYSLGALMYKVLTGLPAYKAKSPVGVLTKHLTADLVPPSQRVPELDIHPDVDAIVARAMAKKRDDRYASASDMLEDLEAAYASTSGRSGSRSAPSLSLTSLGGSTARKHAAAAVPPDDVDYGVDSAVRLQRADLDSYERKLRRRRWVSLLGVPLALAAAAAALVYLLLLRPEPLRTSEAEPNNDPDSATPIALDTEITGYLGKRISKAQPDRDYYRVVAEVEPGTAVTVTVTGLPNIDVDLALLDGTGAILHQRNVGGVGIGETIRDWRVRRPVLVAVGQRMTDASVLPVENVSDPYRVTVQFRTATGGSESEPNDQRTDALDIDRGAAITGYLDRPGDVDSYRYQGPTGAVGLRIGGAGSVPLVWQIDQGEPQTARDATVELTTGAILTLRRQGESTEGLDEPYALELRAR